MWALCYLTLFQWSPRPFWAWRRWLLCVFGAKIGRQTRIHNNARVYFPWRFRIGEHSAIGEHALIYNLGSIEIGDYVTVSQRAHLCAGTHDYSTRKMPLIRAKIVLQDDVWICADAFVGPNVTVCEGAIIGACAVATSDIDAWTIVAGNPAKAIKLRPRIAPDS